MKKIHFLGFLGLLFFSACSPSLSPFTENLRERYNWSEADLKKIQFYVSQDIVLRRDLSSSEARIEDGGKIKTVGGRKVEEVIIRAGTPGVAVFTPKEDRIAISFEKSGKYLMFGANPKQNNTYVLLAKNWENHQGKVEYGEQTYHTSPHDGMAALMVKIKRRQETSYNSRAAKGRTVGN